MGTVLTSTNRRKRKSSLFYQSSPTCGDLHSKRNVFQWSTFCSLGVRRFRLSGGHIAFGRDRCHDITSTGAARGSPEKPFHEWVRIATQQPASNECRLKFAPEKPVPDWHCPCFRSQYINSWLENASVIREIDQIIQERPHCPALVNDQTFRMPSVSILGRPVQKSSDSAEAAQPTRSPKPMSQNLTPLTLRPKKSSFYPKNFKRVTQGPASPPRAPTSGFSMFPQN